VLVTGLWLTVKEQKPDTYPAVLAEPGFTAVTFDFAGFGQSGGDLASVEWPSRMIADLTAAAECRSPTSVRIAGRAMLGALYLRCGLT
jgi:uncharacterized protein